LQRDRAAWEVDAASVKEAEGPMTILCVEVQWSSSLVETRLKKMNTEADFSVLDVDETDD
jgi:hypothetical protein